MDLSSVNIVDFLALISAGVGLRMLRWYYYIRRRGWNVPVGAAAASLLASFSFTATPGKAGELVKGMLLRSGYGVPIADCAGVLFVERIGDLVAVLLLALCALTRLSNSALYLVVAGALVALSVFVLSRRGIHERFVTLIARVPRLARPAQALRVLFSASNTLLRPTPIAIGFGLALAAWTMEGTALYILSTEIFRLPISFGFALGVFGLSTLVGALSMIPGGIGSAEAVIVLLLAKSGASLATGSAVALTFRLCTLWLFSAIGVGALLTWPVLFPSARSARRATLP